MGKTNKLIKKIKSHRSYRYFKLINGRCEEADMGVSGLNLKHAKPIEPGKKEFETSTLSGMKIADVWTVVYFGNPNYGEKIVGEIRKFRDSKRPTLVVWSDELEHIVASDRDINKICNVEII